MDSFIGNQYRLSKKIGEGAFGEVYIGVHNVTQSQVAIKIQNAQNKSPQLFYEAKILNGLTGDDMSTDFGIPRVYYCANEGQCNVMVMDLYGPSLEDLYINIGRRFDLKTTLMIGLQMIERIQYIHNKGYIHRDIKPDNFVIGRGEKSFRVYIIDFGLAKKFIQKDGTHIPYKDNKNLTGTARYASLNTHLGIQQSRRDDLEGIFNVLLYFVNGTLPWQNLKANGKKQKYQRIMDKKLTIQLDKLCQNLPDQFLKMIYYVRSLDFEQKPDYDYLKGLFRNVMQRQKMQVDFRYCWIR